MMSKRQLKPLGFPLLRDVILRLPQNVENHYEYSYLEHPEKAMKKPYKTRGILALLDTISQNALKMIKKPLVFSLMATWTSAEPENIIKPVEMDSFGGPAAGPGGFLERCGV